MDTLKKIFASVLGIPIDSIAADVSKKNTPSWDSLNDIMLITEIEKAFNVKFGYDEALSVKSFSDAVTLLASKGVDPLA